METDLNIPAQILGSQITDIVIHYTEKRASAAVTPVDGGRSKNVSVDLTDLIANLPTTPTDPKTVLTTFFKTVATMLFQQIDDTIEEGDITDPNPWNV